MRISNAKNYTNFTGEQRQSLMEMGIEKLGRSYFAVEDFATWTAVTATGTKVSINTSRGTEASAVIAMLETKIGPRSHWLTENLTADEFGELRGMKIEQS